DPAAVGGPDRRGRGGVRSGKWSGRSLRVIEDDVADSVHLVVWPGHHDEPPVAGRSRVGFTALQHLLEGLPVAVLPLDLRTTADRRPPAEDAADCIDANETGSSLPIGPDLL